MDTANRQIQLETRGSVFCVRLTHRRMNEADLLQLGEELSELIEQVGCRSLVLALGFDTLDCMYSMFLGIVAMARRQILDRGGQMHLCEVGPTSLGVLKTCRLTDLFEIYPEMDDAVRALQAAS